MVDYKAFEERCFEFLKTKFDNVIWLSKSCYSPTDFECIMGDKSFMIEAKYTESKKVRLLPSQRKVDGVVFNEDTGIKLLWKKDFGSKVVY
jgi:hypothetical protein